MTIPSIASSTYTTIGAAAGSATVAAPSGMGSGDFDCLVAYLRATNASKTIATPAGYAQLFQGAYSSNDRHKIAVFHRSAEASPADATVALTDASDIARAGIVRMRVSGVDLADPINVSAGAISEGSAPPSTSPTFTVPGLTTDGADCLAIGLVGWGSSYMAGANGSRFAVSGWTIGAMNHCITAAGNASNPSAVIASKGIAVAGSTGNFVADPEDHANATDQPWVGFMFALNPAAGGPPPAIVRPRIVIF